MTGDGKQYDDLERAFIWGRRKPGLDKPVETESRNLEKVIKIHKQRLFEDASKWAILF